MIAFRIRATLGMTLALASVGAGAMQLSSERMLDLSRNITRMIGMSPVGTQTWAKLSVARAAARSDDGIDRIDRAIGEELAAATPDRRRLAALAQSYAKEKARSERADKERLIADAFRLGDADRRILGRFIMRTRDGRDAEGPVLAPLP